jgi:hypothetical protein
MYVNDRQVPSEGLFDYDHCKVLYDGLSEDISGLGIHNGNTGIQITPA